MTDNIDRKFLVFSSFYTYFSGKQFNIISSIFLFSANVNSSIYDRRAVYSR